MVITNQGGGIYKILGFCIVIVIREWVDFYRGFI